MPYYYEFMVLLRIALQSFCTQVGLMEVPQDISMARIIGMTMSQVHTK